MIVTRMTDWMTEAEAIRVALGAYAREYRRHFAAVWFRKVGDQLIDVIVI